MATTTPTTKTTKKTAKTSAKRPAKGAKPEAADKAATAPAATEAPTAAPAAPGATEAKDGAKGGKRAKAPTAPKVEVLTEDEARGRGGMTEIIKTLKGRDAAERLAAKAGGFVIEHEDGRYSAAKTAEPHAPAEAPEAGSEPEAPAKPKHSFETAPGKALDHILKQGKRRAKAKAAETKPAKGGKVATQPKAAKAPKTKKVSALDAAAQVLAKAKQPMRAKELIEQMAAEGLWTSPGGKTPEATLYAAMIREIGKKGDESRFAKADRGAFVAAGKGA
jgi:hypothetical protein